MEKLPFYLQQKLKNANINISAKLELGSIQTFIKLRKLFPSLGFQALYDLYANEHNLKVSSLPLELKQELISKVKQYGPYYAPIDKVQINFFMQKALEEKGIEIKQAKLERIPLSYAEVNEEQAADIMKLLDKLEEDDDVQAVYHNMAE